jgi:hypothetical protein
MEEEVLDGAKESIMKNHPIMLIETIKSNKNNINKFLEIKGYRFLEVGLNYLAIHQDDPTLKNIKIDNGTLWIS